jgi:outer membrane immunogenic protein
MKMKLALVAASALVAAPALMSAQAQEANVYVSGGYAQFDGNGANPGAIQGRVGVGFGKYFAVEGEGAVGVSKDNGVKIDSEIGLFGVAKLPISPAFDLFGRVGYSQIDSSPGGNQDGLAYGVGGQWNITGKDGIRADWTRHDYDVGDADAYAVSYVRKF